MVEHVGKRCKNFCFNFVNKNTKDPAADHHSGPAKILKRVLFVELRRSKANCIIIFFKVHDLLLNLVQECRSNQFHKLFSTIIDGETGVVSG
jgi:hypothetical protein